MKCLKSLQTFVLVYDVLGGLLVNGQFFKALFVSLSKLPARYDLFETPFKFTSCAF